MSRLFVSNLTVLDFAYLHGARGLLGESWRVHVELAGDLDEQGMVLDFALVKRRIKQTLDRELDHRLLVPMQHPGLRLDYDDNRLRLTFELQNGAYIEHHSPLEAVALIAAPQVDPASVIATAKQLLMPLLPANVTGFELRVEPDDTTEAYFHYTHGLKHHGGNCQRIAHGHRSRIEINRDGERDRGLEADWTARWHDVYIATHEDLSAELERSGKRYKRFCYRSGQGAFELTLPAEHCYLVDDDSTIEHLAQHVASTLAAECQGQRIAARVFEGIDKGAIGEALVTPGDNNSRPDTAGTD